MAKEPVQHLDILGRVLALGDWVAYPDFNNLKLGKVDKINPKMIRITNDDRRRSAVNKYPVDLVKVEGPDLMWYLLKKN